MSFRDIERRERHRNGQKKKWLRKVLSRTDPADAFRRATLSPP